MRLLSRSREQWLSSRSRCSRTQHLEKRSMSEREREREREWGDCTDLESRCDDAAGKGGKEGRKGAAFAGDRQTHRLTDGEIFICDFY